MIHFKQIQYVLILAIIVTILPNSIISQTYNELPESFPDFNINVRNNLVNGYYFMSGEYFGSPSNVYSIILDTLGLPIFYQRHHNRSMGFTLQGNGQLSYYGGPLYDPVSKFVILDSTYSIVNQLGPLNGYILDPHELILLDDGSYWIIALDIRQVDMSQIVPGGYPNASVVGCVIQHINDAQNLIFQWSSWNHMEITDCDTMFVDMTGQVIDYVHPNSLSFDYDGNMLLSSRHLNEITKIDITSGEIIWRWGGKMNQFEFQPDNGYFFGQHSIMYNEGSNSYTLFDNGNWHTPPLSKGLEYELNQNLLTAKLIHTFSHDPEIYTSAEGGMQRLDDGHTIVNWSENINNFIFTEYGLNGEPVFEISCPDTAIKSYRVLKHEWKTSLFDFVEEELNFNNIVVGDSSKKYVSVINNQGYPIVINGYNIENTAFSLETILPVIIESNGSQDFLIKFEPHNNEDYSSVLSLFHSTDTSRVAQQIRLKASTVGSIPDFHFNVKPNVIINPNPFTTSTTLSYNIKQPSPVHFSVFNQLGQLVYSYSEEQTQGEQQLQWDAQVLAEGIYYYQLKVGDQIANGKIVKVR